MKKCAKSIVYELLLLDYYKGTLPESHGKTVL